MAIIEILVYFAIFVGLYFTIFLFSVYFTNQKKIYKEPKKKIFPLVCLIVPCYNEAKNIGKTLHSLLNLDYPKDKLEIIVVDDGSADNTFQTAKTFQARDNKIKVFRKKNGGKYTALNFGLLKTNAKFIGSVDADSYLDISALKKVIKYFEDPKIKAVASTVKISEIKNILTGILYIEYLMAAFWRKFFSLLNGLYITPGAFSVYRREIFKILGPYQDPYRLLAEDLEIAFRLQKKNFKIAYAIDAFVYTKSPTTFNSLLRQRTRWYKAFLLTLKDYLGLLNIKKHGNLSFLLYFSIIFIFIPIILVSYNLWKMIDFALARIHQFALTGFDFSHFFSFDWRFLNFNISPIFVLGNLCLIVFLIYLFFGKKLTFDKRSLKKESFFFILFYTYLNAFWWIAAIFSLLKKQTLYLIKRKDRL